MIDTLPPKTQVLAPSVTAAGLPTPQAPTAHHDSARPGMADCQHQWVGWSGKMRCRLCGATQENVPPLGAARMRAAPAHIKEQARREDGGDDGGTADGP
ncbi:hypothetical protein ACWD4V_18490, partial [Streptomyces tsukubensis]